MAHQCFFYKRYLRDKNADLAASGERLREANAELAVTAETALGLLEVSRALGSSLDPGILIDRLHAVVLERLRTDWCATLIPDAGQRSGHRLVATRALASQTGRTLRAELAALGATMAAGSVREIPAGSDHAVARACAAAGLGTTLVAPMPCRSGPPGLLATGYAGRHGAFTTLQRDAGAGIATQAAMAIENAMLHARQAEEAEVSAALLRVAELLNANLDAADRIERFTALARELVGFDFLNLLLCDAEQRVFRVVAGSHPDHPELHAEVLQIACSVDEYPIFAEACRVGWVETRANVSLDPTAELWMRRLALQSFAVVALNLRGRAIGAIVAGSRTLPGPVAAKTRRLLSGIAQQAAIAVENSRLVENLRAGR